MNISRNIGFHELSLWCSFIRFADAAFLWYEPYLFHGASLFFSCLYTSDVFHKIPVEKIANLLLFEYDTRHRTLSCALVFSYTLHLAPPVVVVLRPSP